jgi:hypothetical protein
MVYGPREHKEQIRQSIHVHHNVSIHVRGAKRHNGAFCPAAHRPREMEQRAWNASARQNEPSEWGERRLEPVNPLLETLNIAIADSHLRHALRDPFAGIREARADRKQIALNLGDQPCRIRQKDGLRAHDAETRVQFIDIAVGRDAWIAFAHSRTPEQARLSGISGARVNLHGGQYAT